MPRISTETPVFEITLRKYEKPDSLDERELVKKVCLSLGLLQPGDSRDVIVDILLVLLRSGSGGLTSTQLEKKVAACRVEHKLAALGIAGSNIRRQIRRLRALYLVEKSRKMYRIAEGDSLANIFSEKVRQFLLPSTIARVEEYLAACDARFADQRSTKNQ